MFTIFCCASLFGEKVNFELQFLSVPTLDELERKISKVFNVEHEERMPPDHPRFDFVVARLQIYDDSLLRWVDLVSPRQLHHLDQVYAFQPQSQWHIDVQKDLPAPRAPSGRHENGIPSPRLYVSPNRSSMSLMNSAPASQQSVQQQPQNGCNTPAAAVDRQLLRDAVSPLATGGSVSSISTTGAVTHNQGYHPAQGLAALRIQLAAARSHEDSLRRQLDAASSETRRLVELIQEFERQQQQQKQEADTAAAAITMNSAGAIGSNNQDAEVAKLREELARVSSELAAVQMGGEGVLDNDCTEDDADSKDSKTIRVRGSRRAREHFGRPVTEKVSEHSSFFDEAIGFFKTVLPLKSKDRPRRHAKQQRAPWQQQQQAQQQGKNDMAGVGADDESDDGPETGSDAEPLAKPDYSRYYAQQTQLAVTHELAERDWLESHPGEQRPPPVKRLYCDGQLIDAACFRQQLPAAIPAPPPRKWCGPGPAVLGEVKPLFKDGLLFRINTGNNSENEWYFYNDTAVYEMIVSYSFGPDSRITVIDDDAQLSHTANGWLDASLTVYPGQTCGFIKGTINGFKSSLRAEPVSREYLEREKRKAAQVVEAETVAVRRVAGMESEEEAVLDACLRNEVRFVDPVFPPADISLSRPGIDRHQIESRAWKRPTQYLPSELHTFITEFRDIEPNDVDQGALGNCWFLCALASLAEFPFKVRDVFEHPVSREMRAFEHMMGAYRVTLNKHGWWVVVIVDDYFPVVGSKPCFAKNKEDPTEQWVSLLEKAYAKAHGSYAAIAGGDALHALQDLTGYPINRIEEDEWQLARTSRRASDEMFDMLLRFDHEKYLINLNTPGVDDSAYMGGGSRGGNTKDFAARYKAAGLGMGHAYSVIKARHFPQHNLRLVLIRNPWGSSGGEWTGAWNDEDPRWKQYPDVAAGCDFVASDDGQFWMTWEDALEYFDGGGACLTKFNWFDYRAKGSFLNGVPQMCFEIHCTAPVEAFVIVSQTDKRVDHTYKNQAMLLTVCRTVRGRGGARMELDVSSTNDADAPAEEAPFCFSRDRAVHYKFTPAHSPYLIVPRLYDAESIPYVLGIISEQRAGDGIDVHFKAMLPECRLLKHFKNFPHGDGVSVETVRATYQFNPEVGCPTDCEGTCLSNV